MLNLADSRVVPALNGLEVRMQATGSPVCNESVSFTIEVMDLVQYLLQARSTRFLLLILIVQSLYLLLFRSQTSNEVQRLATGIHRTAEAILSANVTIHDFGLMARKVSALSNLAEHYSGNPSFNSSRLNNLVSEQFPWWNQDKLQYFPWKSKPMHQRPLSDLNVFGPKTGIVICAGDEIARETAHLISFLRDVHKSKLPIDIAYVGDDDLTPSFRSYLLGLGDNIGFIDLTTVFDDRLVHLKSYATKPFALLASRYQHTILMDADAVPFSRPDRLFKDYGALRDNGALFFHDRSMATDNLIRQGWLAAQLEAAGLQPSAHLTHNSLFGRRWIAEEADSAMIFIDKSRPRVYMAMLFACWMNIKEVREAVTWDLFFGEKESYWLATELTGVPYSFEAWSSARLAVSPPSTVSSVYSDDWKSPEQWPPRGGGRRAEAGTYSSETGDEAFDAARRCTTHMVHANARGDEPLWANGGLWLDKRDRNLGFANWTHWYLGEGITKVVRDIDLDSNGVVDVLKPGDESSEEIVEARRKSQQVQIMNTQPAWLSYDWGQDAAGCPQPDETRWEQLSPDFQSRVQRMIDAARRVETKFIAEFG